MGEAILTLLQVTGTFQFLTSGQPLKCAQGDGTFADLGCPPCSSIERLSLVMDELPDTATFVLRTQPFQVTMPGVARNFLNILDQAGEAVVFRPSPYDRIQGSQARVFIHPSPVPGSQDFDLGLDSIFALVCWS